MSQQLIGCPEGFDDTFGPWAGPVCRGGFDFTLLFEESILSILPQCIFLLILPIRIGQLMKEDVKVVPSLLRWLKVSTSITLLILNIALLALWAQRPDGATTTRTTIPAAALTFVASTGVCLLTWLEHERSIRPQLILSVYLSLTTLIDLARTRTLWMIYTNRSIPAIFTSTMAIRALLLVLESIAKRNSLVPAYKSDPREVTSSTISRSTFFWLTPLLRKGYKKILRLDDLDLLDKNMGSERVGRVLVQAWFNMHDRAKPGVLFSTWLSAFSGALMAPVVPKLLQIGFNYTQPFLIQSAIGLAVLPDTQPFNNWGYGLIGAYAIVYTGIAVSSGQYEHRIYRAATMMRGSINALIYQKSLRLDIVAGNTSPEAALTMVGTDTETMIQGLVQLHELWGGFIEIGVGIYLVYRQLGAACAIPVAVNVAALIGTIFVAVPAGKAQAVWIQASQDRVTSTSKTLANIKWLKISGLTDTAFAVLRKLRGRELKLSERYRLLMGITMILLTCPPIIIPIITFGTYAGIAAGGNQTLTISKAFTSMSVFSLLSQPLAQLVVSLPLLVSAMTSFQRVQDFLNAAERKNDRIDASTEEKEKGTIVFIDGSYAWKEDSEPVIDIANCTIRRQSFTVVLGPVGCGKSTLLKALLGELSSFNGTITTNFSGVAYCSQSPWLPNGTVRNVIIGPAEFNESWYETVIRACALEQDLDNWSKGDQTIVGTKGISLSGGQKHRIAIARAVYSRREFQIFDDVFSGLDSTTASSILGNLFGAEGLLRKGHVTVLVTSSDGRMVTYADEILILNDKGRIEDKGSPSDLGSKSRRFESLAEEIWQHKKGTSDAQNAQEDRIDATLTAKQLEADSMRRLGDPQMYKFYAKAAGWLPLAIFIISMFLLAFCGAFTNVWLKWWSEANIAQPNEDLGKWLGVYAVLGVGSIFTLLFGLYQLFIVVINNSGLYFHNLLVDTTSRATMSFHSTTDSGVTINRFSQDLQQIDMELPLGVLNLAIAISNGLGTFVLICVSGKYFSAFLPILVVVFYIIQRFYLRTSRQMRLLDIEYKAPVLSHLISTLHGISTLRAFNWESNFTAQAMNVIDDSQRPSYLFYCLQRWLTFAMDMMVTGIAVVLIILVSTLREQIGPGYTGIALSNILAFSVMLKTALTAWIMLETALGAIARVRSFASETKSEWDMDGKDWKTDEEWPKEGRIELREVTASYSSSNIVLRDVTFDIKPGERVAVCGRTGSGKSSLALALLRMIDVDYGSIFIDGISLDTIPPEYVRSSLVAVPQEPYIFDGTIRMNVDPSETASDAEMTHALKSLQLWDRVDQRGGLDAVIDDKFFSQGEAQLLMLARAMVRKGRVLILDEVTSSLDDKSTKLVDEMVVSWFKDWTVITIMHKLNSILEYDKVVLLDTGRLVEYDEPRKLLERDSEFKKMYEMSSRRTE